MTRKLSVKERVLKLLGKGTPMLSIDMATVLKITKASASTAAKELHDNGFIHVSEWRHNPKNGGNKVYAIGTGVDAVKPESRYSPRNKALPADDPSTFVPHADVAASWLRNPI